MSKIYRFLCFFFTGKKIIITNAFQKKTQKLPKNQK
ncbi:MAG: type II toxin-antitoxin system RelE/ParE family toxin [Dolichospermum sp.]